MSINDCGAFGKSYGSGNEKYSFSLRLPWCFVKKHRKRRFAFRKKHFRERGSAGEKENWFLVGNYMAFPLERGSAGQGGRGDSDLPPMPPWTPYTPFKRPRDTPGPPLWRKGYFLLLLDRQGPYRARPLVWPGARSQSGVTASTHFARHRCRGTFRYKVALPWRFLAITSGIDRHRGAGEGSAAPKATVALPGTDVNLAGRAPARLAVHCILATGGPGAAMRHAPFGRPRHPLGTFPCGKVPRPPAGGRNLSQETGFL